MLVDGDPSQDVVHASVIFLVDAKLVLLQPSKDETGKLKYDMRIIANDVEYFSFLRDQNTSRPGSAYNLPSSASAENGSDGIRTELALQDSLWYFNGSHVKCWTDAQDLLKPSSLESSKEIPQPISISTDFYPTSIALRNGVVIGIESELVQRRDAYFAFFRYAIRVNYAQSSHYRLLISYVDAIISTSNHTPLPLYLRLAFCTQSILPLPIS